MSEASEDTRTVVVLIGNSDNKLTQEEWWLFVGRVRAIMLAYCKTMHFDGGSNYDCPYQNACFVGEVEGRDVEWVLNTLSIVRKNYKQDSVAVVVNEVQLI